MYSLLYSGRHSLLLIILCTLPRQFKYFGDERSLFPLKGIKLWFHGWPVHSHAHTHSWIYFNPQQGWTVRGSIPSVGKMFSLLHTQTDQPCGALQPSLQWVRDVVLTSPHPPPNLMLRLRMRTAIPLLPLCAFYGMLLGDLYLYIYLLL